MLLLISMLLAWTPFAQENKSIDFEVRAKQNLLMGKGETTGREYYDVVITRTPTAGVLIKLIPVALLPLLVIWHAHRVGWRAALRGAITGMDVADCRSGV